MKPIIKKKCAIFYPQGFLDSDNARQIIEQEDINTIIEEKCKIVVVSLKKIIFFNRHGISVIHEDLRAIENQTGAIVGFCDYDRKKFNSILDMYKQNIIFSMFDSEEIALLFATSIAKDPSKCKILIYNDQAEQKDRIQLELYELGYRPDVASSRADFEAKKGSYEFAIERTILKSINKCIHAYIKNNVIIYTLSDFLDSSINDQFDMAHHNNALKIGFTNFLFDCSEVLSINVHAINFFEKIIQQGRKYGAIIAICGLKEKKLTQINKEILENCGILLFDTIDEFFSKKDLNTANSTINNQIKPRNVTKKLIEVLPIVLEVIIKTIDSLAHCSIKKKEVKVQELDFFDQNEKVNVSLAFYGQIEGVIALSFDQYIAKKASILFTDSNNPNYDELLDGACELINIIGNKLISQFALKDLKTDITMPRAYANSKELIENKKGIKGVQIDLQLDGKLMHIFLTK